MGLWIRASRNWQQVEKANERLAGIDVRLAKIETKMDQYATKADIESVKTAVAAGQNKIIMGVVGSIFIAQVLPALPGVLRAFP